MTFADPVWLYLIPALLIPLGLLLAYGLKKRNFLLTRFAAERLLDRLTEEAGRSRTVIKSACILLAAGAIAFALARPQLGVEWSERKARGLDIVFIIDSSKSMLATDLRPTRLDRAKLAVIDLVERLESDRIGLVAFAGQAFLQTPPTLDYSAFRESLDSVGPNIMTSGGSHLGFALEEAAKAFPTENNVKVAVLLTDGEDLGGRALAAAESAQKDGIQIFCIGIGTPEGEYLKIENEQGVEVFLRDADDQPVLSKLDETTLREIARITDGGYSRLSGDSLNQLYRSVIATLPREERRSELQEIRTERFQWAISTALIFLILDILIRRRRQSSAVVTVVLITGLLSSPSPTHAETGSLRDHARLSFNAAHDALAEANFGQAAELFEASIANTDDTHLQSDALYNLGHMYYQIGTQTYQSGDLQGALEQIKQSEAYFESTREMKAPIDGLEDDLDRIQRVREAMEERLEQEQQQDEPNEESENSEDEQQENDDSQGDQQSESESNEQDQDSGESGQEQNNQSNASNENSNSEKQDSNSSEQDSRNDRSAEDSDNQSDQDEAEDRSSEENGEPPEPSEDEGKEPEQPVSEAEEPGEEASELAAGRPESGEAINGEESEGQSTATTAAQSVEGMTEEDAAALLDSLRENETLLPFIDQPRGGRPNEIRDW
ncbi:MAG: VWA domain-containing protein [Opitutales bacterium]